MQLPTGDQIVETGRGDRVFLIRDAGICPAEFYVIQDGKEVARADSLRYGRKAFERVCQEVR